MSVEHVGTCDVSDSGCLEDLPDLRMADDLLFEYRIKHSLHCALDIFDRLIDDVIASDIDVLCFCLALCLGIGLNVESDDDRIGCTRKVDIRFIDRTYAAVDNLNDNFLI